MNGKITLDDIRKVLCENLDYAFCDKTKNVKKLSDEELLKVNIEKDLVLDSLDFIVLTMTLERNCNVVIPNDAFDAFQKKDGTIEALLEEYNRFLIASLNS